MHTATSLLVTALVALSWGCNSNSGSGGKSTDQIVEKAPAHASLPALASLLPSKVDSWIRADEVRQFGPDNLYDLINGGAEIYVDFGLQTMVTVEYKNAAQASVTVIVELYDMGTPKGAFGRLARFLKEKKDPQHAGKGLPETLESRGIFGIGNLVYWKDKFLVHITLLDATPTATPASIESLGRDILPKFAWDIAGLIKNDPALPSVLGAMPQKDRLPRSEQWQPTGLAGLVGCDGNLAGFVAAYQRKENRWTAFVSESFAKIENAAACKEKLTLTDPALGMRLKTAGPRVVGIIFVPGDKTFTDKGYVLDKLADNIRSLDAGLTPDG